MHGSQAFTAHVCKASAYGSLGHPQCWHVLLLIIVLGGGVTDMVLFLVVLVLVHHVHLYRLALRSFNFVFSSSALGEQGGYSVGTN